MSSLEDFTTGIAVRSGLHVGESGKGGTMRELAAFVGWDWADREHELRLREVGTERIGSSSTPGRESRGHRGKTRSDRF
jgi:hypothetical protein